MADRLHALGHLVVNHLVGFKHFALIIKLGIADSRNRAFILVVNEGLGFDQQAVFFFGDGAGTELFRQGLCRHGETARDMQDSGNENQPRDARQKPH